MRPYTEIQNCWYIIIIFAGIIVAMTLALMYQWGNNPMTLPVYCIMIPLMILPMLLFYNMKTTVDNNQITISYGVGWIKKQIRLDSLMSAKVVKGRWYHGAGIKHLDGGMLYSINFTGSVELRTKYSDKFIRIGSSDTERLTSEICKRISMDRGK